MLMLLHCNSNSVQILKKLCRAKYSGVTWRT